MAKIKLSELCPAGSELLQDSESFLTELSDPELENVVGGNSLIVIEKPSFSLVTITKDILIGISIFWD
ncbi:MAG: hypothetical protein QNJ70_07245 [Xenococcaceae cyanobacterium MO_207.B15]|nr:hypothetical protein [Xenococcaceae cyanobacterium MO_207.B15]